MRRQLLAAASAAALLALSACGSSGSSSSAGGPVTLDYWLWDSAQQPAYQQCADDFHAKNPNITVKVTQKGWDDYWSTLTAQMVSGTAPDVFTDHLAKYGQFVAKHQILPIDQYVQQGKVDLNQYEPGLADLWVAQDGKRYGLPKDWDTVGLFYNKKLTREAGLTDEQLRNLTWNPTDGGSYEKLIAHLTVDANGRRGDEPGFDRSNVKVYGLWFSGSNPTVGQTEWSMYALTTGWQPTDKPVWGTHYNYDDPRLLATIGWWKSLIDKGFMPTFAAQQGVQWSDQLAAGKVAMATNGDWNINTVYGNQGLEPGIAPTPIGPNGKRASMFNGLADAIYAGTKHKDAAASWVTYLASADCENAVGARGVVFPAITSAWERAQQADAAKGIDVTPFTDHVKNKDTTQFPITLHAAEIDAILKPALQGVMSGQAPVSSLVQANQQVNALFK